jgi:GMP synthase (glutamine-hydrolysing)
MRIHYITHASYEGLGVIRQWATEKNFVLTGTKSHEGEILPDPDSFDVLIIMGGPQSACEIAKYPYLQNEVKLIQAANKKNKYILGICLGGQLIGTAFGAPAQRSPEKEIGYFPIEITTEGKSDRIFQHLPDSFPSIHWHFDMMGLPKEAKLLAKSAGCPRQAIQFNERVYGLQFHLEFTPDRLQTLIDQCRDDFAKSPYTQTPREMLAANFSTSEFLMRTILDKLVSG